MRTKPKNIHVLMPDDTIKEVMYYCDDKKAANQPGDNFTKLYIQLDDCVCTMTIDKALCIRKENLEHIVQTKVINSRGHLC